MLEEEDGKIACTVYGPSDMSITWYLDDTLLEAGDLYDISNVSGTTKTNLE